MTKAQGQKRRAHGMVPLAGPQSAQMHSGIGSSVKPAYEPIVVGRKPLSEKNLVQNILKHGEWLEGGTVYKAGTGGLNIDQSRVGIAEGDDKAWRNGNYTTNGAYFGSDNGSAYRKDKPSGRFPANTLWSHVPGPNGCVRVGSRRVKPGNGSGTAKGQDRRPLKRSIYGSTDTLQEDAGFVDPDGLEEVPEYICADSCPVKALDEQSGVSKSGGTPPRRKDMGYHGGANGNETTNGIGSTEGHASRFFSQFHEPGFFYAPKASRAERNRGLEGMPEKLAGVGDERPGGSMHERAGDGGKVYRQNNHPTVKPVKLLSYLVKLVTPPNGTVLDPFAGSGTTGVAAISEGFNAILIEQDEEYCEIAERRILYHSLPEAERVDALAPKQVGGRMKKGEVKTAREWGLKNMHPQDMLLRYNPDERPEEGGTFEPVKETWEDKRTGPEPDDLNFREVVEKYASALSKTEEQFKDKLF